MGRTLRLCLLTRKVSSTCHRPRYWLRMVVVVVGECPHPGALTVVGGLIAAGIEHLGLGVLGQG